MNNVQLIGNLTQSPTLRYTQSGTPVLSFRVAVTTVTGTDDSGNRREETCFISCSLFGKRGESLGRILGKGHRVGVSGRLQLRTWEDSDGNPRSTYQVLVRDVDLLTPRGQQVQQANPPEEPPPPSDEDAPGDDEIPF